MVHPNGQEGAPSALNPPPYSEKDPYDQEPPPVYEPASPTVPTEYQSYYALPGQETVIQTPLHTVYVVPVDPSPAPDYLACSILTMLFCCLPLGIAAVVYSVRTRNANRMGNVTKAQENSSTARMYYKSALWTGIILFKIIILIRFLQRRKFL